MTREDIIAGLKRRVARAEAAGRLESYFGAYEHAGLMTELDIHYNGRSYQYRDYRYDQLADAVNYARLDRARTLEDSPPVAETAPPETARRKAPTAS